MWPRGAYVRQVKRSLVQRLNERTVESNIKFNSRILLENKKFDEVE